MKTKTILVADETERLLSIVTDNCEHRGVDVRCAQDARQALFMVHTRPPDLVVIDSSIDAEDALSVCQLMFSDPRLRRVPVVMLAADQGSSLRARAEELAVHFVTQTQDPWKVLAPLIDEVLELSAEDTAENTPRAATPTQPALDHGCINGPVVLVVDDDEVIIQALEIRLGASGYRVICATDGVAAFTLAKKHQPDIMTLDVGLPGMDGLGLMQNLTAHPLTTNIPVIVLTGQRDDQLEKMFRNLGAFAFLSKPCSSQTLLKNIADALELYGPKKKQLRT